MTYLDKIITVLLLVIGPVVMWRRLGGWRGIRTPRIFWPLLIAAFGATLSIVAASLEREKVAGEVWVPNPAWMGVAVFAGLGIFFVGFAVAVSWNAVRFMQLHRVVERIDDHVQGAEPFPLPQGNAALLQDVALAARLTADPALSHAMDPLVVERIGDLHAGRVARPLPAPRA